MPKKKSEEEYEIMKVNHFTNVVQSNYLIENKPKMTLDELRMFITLVSTINEGDTDFKNIQIYVKDIIDLWGISPNNAYKQVKKSLNGLMSKKFELEYIRENNTRYVEATTYVSSFSYGEGDGYATVKIDPMFKPYLLDLKEKYTLFGSSYFLMLESPVCARTYELLMQYVKIGKRSFTIDDYKKKVGIEDKYKGSNANLKKYVLEKVVDEISSKTNILVRYDIEGRGDKAVLTFAIIEKDKIEVIESSGYDNRHFAVEEKELLLELMKDLLKIHTSFTDKQLKEIIEIATLGVEDPQNVTDRLSVIEKSYASYLDQIAKKIKKDEKIRNKYAYFKKILRANVQALDK